MNNQITNKILNKCRLKSHCHCLLLVPSDMRLGGQKEEIKNRGNNTRKQYAFSIFIYSVKELFLQLILKHVYTRCLKASWNMNRLISLLRQRKRIICVVVIATVGCFI